MTSLYESVFVNDKSNEEYIKMFNKILMNIKGIENQGAINNFAYGNIAAGAGFILTKQKKFCAFCFYLFEKQNRISIRHVPAKALGNPNYQEGIFDPVYFTRQSIEKEFKEDINIFRDLRKDKEENFLYSIIDELVSVHKEKLNKLNIHPKLDKTFEIQLSKA